MNRTNTRAMVETAFLTTIVVMLTLVGTGIPFLSLLATLVAPAGIALVGIRWGSRYSCASSVVAFLLVAMLMGPLLAIGTVLMYSLPSIFLGEAFRSNWSFRRLIILPTIILSVTSILGLGLSASLTSFDISNFTNIIDVELKNALVDAVKQQQQMTPEQMDAYINQITFAISQAKRMLVAYWFCANAVVVYIMAKLVAYLARRTDSLDRTLPAMASWRMPIWGAGVLAIGLIIVYGLSYLKIDNEMVTNIGMNLGLFGGFVCGLNGITCLLSIMDSYKLGKFFKILIVGFLYFASPITLVVFGIFDMFLDMRGRFRQRLQ